MNELTLHTVNLPQNTYKPSEIIGIFNSILAKQSVNAQVVYLRGIYLANPKQGNWSYCYDTLRDEDSQEELTLRLAPQQRENLKNGNLVNVGGVLNRNISNKGYIQLVLNVSRIEIMQEQAIDETEIKRMELRQKKSAIGFKNVDFILEQLLYTDQRPRIALILAQTSITMSDFNAGINAAKSAIDFFEYRVNFSNSTELVKILKNIDKQCYTMIAIVRGGGGGIEKLDELITLITGISERWGGGGIEKLDELIVLETIINMKTPIISAIGHVEEKLFIKQIVDKEAPTPNGLGQYFSDMVETVNEKKNRSRAVLTEQIKKQFQEQLMTGQKQNKELQEKLVFLTKTQETAQRLHKEQVESANKQNQDLQKKLAEISKANENAQKNHADQMNKLQAQLKIQTEQSNKQSKEFNDSLKKMQETNGELNKSLQKLTAQNTQTAKDLNEAKERARELEKQLEEARLKTNKGCFGIVVAVITVIGSACYAICLIL